MALVRPSLILQAVLKPSDYSETAVKEIKRSYMHIAQSMVKQADQEQDGNVIRLCIRLMKPYWDTSDRDACTLWDSVMPKWIRNTSRNLSNAMRMYNTVMHPFGIGRIVYNWADFEFDDNVVLRVKLDGNTIPDEMPMLAERARQLTCGGAFGEGEVVLIRMPSADSYRSQVEAREQASTQKDAVSENEDAEAVPPQEVDGRIELSVDSGAPSEAAVLTTGDDVRVEEGALNGAADADAESADELEAYSESVSDEDETGPDEGLVEEAVGDAVLVYGSGDSEPSARSETVERARRARSFDIDYSVWDVEFADGRIVEFDTNAL